MNLCVTRVFWLTIILVTCILSMIYVYNVRIEGMRVKYECPSSLQETSEGLFKIAYPDNSNI